MVVCFGPDVEVTSGCKKFLSNLSKQMLIWLENGTVKPEIVDWHSFPVTSVVAGYRGIDYLVTIDVRGELVKAPAREIGKVIPFRYPSSKSE